MGVMVRAVRGECAEDSTRDRRVEAYEEFKGELEHVEHYVVKCSVCGKALGDVYVSGPDYQFYPRDGCEHLEWVPVGNGCIEDPDNEVCRGTRELLERAVKIYYDDTTVYLLVPRNR